MVIEPSGVQHTHDFGWVRCASLIWNDKYDFRQKLHDVEFNYHFFKAILKSQNSVSWKDESGNAFTSHFICETEMMWFRTKMMWFKNRNDAIWKINDVI